MDDNDVLSDCNCGHCPACPDRREAARFAIRANALEDASMPDEYDERTGKGWRAYRRSARRDKRR